VTRFGSMADDLMEREGEVAGGRSMQRLILCVCVFVCAGARQESLCTYFLLLHVLILLFCMRMYLFSTFACTYFDVLHMVQRGRRTYPPF
jgi:hypothetical protein